MVAAKASYEWRDAVRSGIDSYRKVLENLETGRDTHNRRNGIYGEDYVHPGISVTIPLFWGTF